MTTPNILTRRIFRAILAGKPYRIPECRRQLSLRPQTHRTSTVHYPAKRTLFNWSAGKTPQTFKNAKITSKNVEVALSMLVDLVRAQRTQSRAPSDAELVDALRFLFLARSQSANPMTRNEIFLATETFQYLKKRDLILSSSNETSLSEEDLQNAILALAIGGGKDKFRSDSRLLATRVYDLLQERYSSKSTHSGAGDTQGILLSSQLFDAYVTILSRTGSSQEALKLLRSSEQGSSSQSLKLWVSTMKGLASEGRTNEVWGVLEEVKTVLGGLDPLAHEDLTSFFADVDDVQSAQKVFESSIVHGKSPTTNCLAKIVSMFVRTKQFQEGAPFVKQLRERSDAMEAVETLLLWQAARNPDTTQVRNAVNELSDSGMLDTIGMSTFNRLLQHAYNQKKPELAQSYLDLAQSYGQRPDAATYAIQLDYQRQTGDLNAAAETFEVLSFEDIPEERVDIPVLNQFIAALAFAPTPNYELLMRVVDRMLETKAELDSESIAGLCRVLLQRDDLEEATSLLRHRVDFYPKPERARIAAVFKDFITDPTIKDQRAWNAYEIYRHAFPEASIHERLDIMRVFFNRERSDLGCLVFGHMRQREDLEARPTAEAYAQCYEGIAQCKDVDGLQMCYNMLKLDREVEQTTRIRNGLMEAYTACSLPFLAIIDHFWKILDSKEGPSLSSFALALRACEKWVPQGGQEARRIIALMQKWDLIITKDLYDCYIGALAGQSEFDNVAELIEKMEEDIGERPDAVTIGTFYNAIPWQYRKDEVEKWAKKAFPDLWEGLMTYGDEVDEEWEIRYFKIDRSIDLSDEPLFAEGEYRPELADLKVSAIDMPQS